MFPVLHSMAVVVIFTFTSKLLFFLSRLPFTNCKGSKFHLILAGSQTTASSQVWLDWKVISIFLASFVLKPHFHCFPRRHLQSPSITPLNLVSVLNTLFAVFCLIPRLHLKYDHRTIFQSQNKQQSLRDK